MFTRKVVTVSAAAIAAVALSVPLVQAQDGVPSAGSADAGSLDAGSLMSEDGPGGSLASASGEGGGEGAGEASGSAGSLGSASGESGGSAGSEDGSLAGLVPTTAPAASCELPDLGGSVAKFYPLFGLTDLPSGAMDLITSALSSFPNLLDMVAGDGSALLAQTGSLTDPLCTSIFGGEMVQPPVTVIVDGDGNPVTTVTGTVANDSEVSGMSASRAGTFTSTLSDSNSAEDTVEEDARGQSTEPAAALPTTVPVP